MTGSDDDFDDFLKRRKPVFRSPDDGMFEPPAELDRVVLRQAREAIETARPVRVFRNPRWATPVALAATLVLAFTVLFYAGLPQRHEPVPEVSVQNVSEQVPMQAAPPPAVANNQVANEEPDDSVVVELKAPPASRRESAAVTAPPPPAASTVAGASAQELAREPAIATASADASVQTPDWRRDAKTWLAEIERLRNAGDTARADAELAEYKRQQRAYAVAPDR